MLVKKYRAGAAVTIELADQEEAKAIFNSLKPESKRPVSHRSRVMIARDGRRLKLKFLSTDPTALRASMNSYLRFVLACKKVVAEIRALEA